MIDNVKKIFDVIMPSSIIIEMLVFPLYKYASAITGSPDTERGNIDKIVQVLDVASA